MNRLFVIALVVIISMGVVDAVGQMGAKHDAKGKPDESGPSAVQPQIDKYMPVQQALDLIESELKKAQSSDNGYGCHCVYNSMDNIQVDRNGFQFRASGEARGCIVGRGKWSGTMEYRFSNMGYVPVSDGSTAALPGQKLHTWCEPKSGGVFLNWESSRDFKLFAVAVNRMIWASSAEATEEQARWAEFQEKARVWREAGSKTQYFSDDARREKLLAEDAISEKNLDSAVQHYEAGLRIQPLWPEAWFNLGLIYGEMKDYGKAADRMKHYLELMPSASNAQAAKDKILLWEAKINEPDE